MEMTREEYNPTLAPIIMHYMEKMHMQSDICTTTFFKERTEMFREKGIKATKKEVSQLHQRNCFGLIDMNSIILAEKHKAVEALLFLCEKEIDPLKTNGI